MTNLSCNVHELLHTITTSIIYEYKYPLCDEDERQRWKEILSLN
jgi:hypothetical protein